MSLIDSLHEKNLIDQNFNINQPNTNTSFVELDVVLKPVDFYSILEALKISAPLICQVLKNFGSKINQNLFSSKDFKDNIQKYEELTSNILSELESDYLKSGQLEMIMSCAKTKKQIGILDIDVTDADALSIKSKLTDGKFRVIGRISRQIGNNENMSLVQRTILSSLIDIVGKVVNITEGGSEYNKGIFLARNIAQQVCQLNLPGPAVRVMAMSVCI